MNADSPNNWQPPSWHSDHGDPVRELDMLRSFSNSLLALAPDSQLELQTPEPGLMYVRGKLADNRAFEVHSVVGTDGVGSRKIGLFVEPNTSNEVEAYFDSLEQVVVFLTEGTENRRRIQT